MYVCILYCIIDMIKSLVVLSALLKNKRYNKKEKRKKSTKY